MPLAPGEIVFAKGAPGSYVYWVLSGRLRLTLTSTVAGKSIENLGLHNAETRIWSRLVHLSSQYGQTNGSDHSIRIVHRLSQQDLADSVGLTRVMVNRQLKTWRDHHLTKDRRGVVVILDPNELEAFVWRRANSK